MFSFIKTAAIGMTAVALSVTAAAAAEAQATGSVNVRSGPGTNYGVLGQLHGGDSVNVSRQSTNGWCFVQRSGPNGWVSCRYLVADNSGYGDNAYQTVRPNVTIGFGQTSRFGYGWNDRRHDGRYYGRHGNSYQPNGFSFSFGN